MKVFPASETTNNRQQTKVSPILFAVGLTQLGGCVPFIIAVTFAAILGSGRSVSSSASSSLFILYLNKTHLIIYTYIKIVYFSISRNSLKKLPVCTQNFLLAEIIIVKNK